MEPICSPDPDAIHVTRPKLSQPAGRAGGLSGLVCSRQRAGGDEPVCCLDGGDPCALRVLVEDIERTIGACIEAFDEDPLSDGDGVNRVEIDPGRDGVAGLVVVAHWGARPLVAYGLTDWSRTADDAP
jgi:hypothetical protein